MTSILCWKLQWTIKVFIAPITEVNVSFETYGLFLCFRRSSRRRLSQHQKSGIVHNGRWSSSLARVYYWSPLATSQQEVTCQFRTYLCALQIALPRCLLQELLPSDWLLLPGVAAMLSHKSQPSRPLSPSLPDQNKLLE